eukprot:365554-Chlamydomonas_euryale.AAC.4
MPLPTSSSTAFGVCDARIAAATRPALAIAADFNLQARATHVDMGIDTSRLNRGGGRRSQALARRDAHAVCTSA